MAGYWRLPEETAEVLTPDGWLRSGDAARMDDEGFVEIVDRMSAAFVSDGHVVFPGDVERVLLEHPSVADVGVVGGRERIVAFVVAAGGTPAAADDLIAFASRRLPAHARPSEVRFVGGLPRSSVGKLLREELRATVDAGAAVA